MRVKLWKNAARTLVPAVLGVWLLGVSSCEDELESASGSEEKIVFRVEDGNLSVSRAGSGGGSESDSTAFSRRIPLLLDGDTLALTVRGGRNTTDLFGGTVTRGTPLDNSTNKLTSFRVKALAESDGVLYFEEDIRLGSDGIGQTGRFWPTGESLLFFAYAATQGASVEPAFSYADGAATGSFSYSVPDTKATAQPDLVFAVKSGQTKETANGNVSLTFHHALSAIEFKIGAMPQTAKTVTLQSITFSGLYGAGTCDMTGTDNALAFDWTLTGEANNSYTQTFDKTGNGNQGEDLSTAEQTFLLIPQAFGDEAKLTLKFKVGDQEYTHEKPMKEITAAWEADKRYIYTIGISDDMEVTVDDEVAGPVKNNLTIQNSGLTDGYIRAAIVGYWVNSNGDIVFPWNETEYGTFSGLPGSGWTKGNDGFYYYGPLVMSGDYTTPLFTSYTLNRESPVPGAKLELSIVVQIRQTKWQE